MSASGISSATTLNYLYERAVQVWPCAHSARRRGREMTRGGLETVSTESGTEGSNPALSSDESATNRAAAWEPCHPETRAMAAGARTGGQGSSSFRTMCARISGAIFIGTPSCRPSASSSRRPLASIPMPSMFEAALPTDAQSLNDRGDRQVQKTCPVTLAQTKKEAPAASPRAEEFICFQGEQGRL